MIDNAITHRFFYAFRSSNSIQDNQPEIPIIEPQAGFIFVCGEKLEFISYLTFTSTITMPASSVAFSEEQKINVPN